MSHFITGTGTKLAAGLQDNYFYNATGCTVNVPINITSVTLDPAVEKGTEENLLKKKLKDSSYLLSITMDGSFDANLRPEMTDWLFKASTQKADQPQAEEQTIGDKVYTIQEYYLQEPGNDPIGSTFVLTRSDNNVITTYPAMTVRSLTLNAPNNDFVTVSVDLAGREELRAAYTFGPNTMPAKTSGITADGVAGPKTLLFLGLESSSSSSGKYSQNDIELLAKLIAAEARGESYIGQVAVGAVVLNRVAHSSFPDTIAGVIYQPGAFTATVDG